MNITHYGHACFLVEEDDTRILFDPGAYSTGHTDVRDVDAILITHEHQDHMDIPSIKKILENNPEAVIITNKSVHEALEKEGIKSEVVEDGETATIGDVTIEGIGTDHATIHSAMPVPQNVGYLIAGKLFHPGDALTHPKREIDILALPLGGPWMKLAEGIDYAIKVKPRVAFPMHDAMFKNTDFNRGIAKNAIEKEGITFVIVPEQEETTL